MDEKDKNKSTTAVVDPQDTSETTGSEDAETADYIDKLLRVRSKTQSEKQGVDTLMYTPQGFIKGKINPRSAEREVAKKTTRDVESGGKLKTASKKALDKGKNWYIKLTPAAWVFSLAKKYLPENVKPRLRRLFPKKKVKESLEEEQEEGRKNAKEYQREWNNTTILRAIKKGYDRNRLIRKVREWKVWKSKAWKYGKYAVLGPGVAGGIDAYRWNQARKEHQESSEQERATQPSQPISSSGYTPSQLSSRRLTGSYSKRYGNPISRLGRKINPLGQGTIKGAAKSAAKRVGSQLARKAATQAALAFFKTPPGWITLGVIAAIILFIALVMTIITTISGGGESDFAIGVPPPGAQPPSTAKPIPNLILTKSVDKTIIPASEELTYSISYSYPSTSSAAIKQDDITVYDTLSPDAEFKSATGKYAYEDSTRTISWKLSEPKNTSPLVFVVSPLRDNIVLSNKAYALAVAPASRVIDISSSTLNQIFNDASSRSGIPLAFLKAIAKKESSVISYSDEDVSQFNQTAWWSNLTDDAPTISELPELIKRGYAYNTCAYPKSNPICPGSDVRGVMQFELKTWNSIKTGLSFPDVHDPDRRYLRDIVFGASEFIARSAQQYEDRFHFSNNSSNWNEEQVKALARTYCGGNPDANVANDPACGPYDTLVWDYYREFRAAEDSLQSNL